MDRNIKADNVRLIKDRMMEHIQWIFSGIGILIISLLINYFRKRKKVETKQNIIETTATPSTLTLDAKQIWEELDNHPPFQVEQIASNYYGNKIRWEVTLELTPTFKDNTLTVMSLYKGKYPWVYFTVDIDKYPILKTLKKGTKFIVTGKISKIGEGGFTIDLETIEE